jgi:hypothetical protein
MARRGLVVVGSIVAVVAAVLCCAAPVLAAPPGVVWSIESIAEPTNFNASDSPDVIEELVVTATGGTYELQPGQGVEVTQPIAWNATPGEVGQALEALPEIGPGAVTVTSRTAGEYTITFVGRLSARAPGGLEVVESKLTNGAGEGTTVRERLQQGEARDQYTLRAVNVGGRPSEGEVLIAEELPPGLALNRAEIVEPLSNTEGECVLGTPLRCTFKEPVHAGRELFVRIQVAVESPSLTGSLPSRAVISGGGAAGEASTSASTPVNAGIAPFGIARFAFGVTNPLGAFEGQAGAHPYAVTTTIQLNSQLNQQKDEARAYDVVQDAKDIAVELPLGFLGDPLAAPQCTEAELTDRSTAEGVSGRAPCPSGSLVGAVRLVWNGGAVVEPLNVYNMVPEHGYPAELGFMGNVFPSPILMYASVVPSPSGYRLRVDAPGEVRVIDIEDISLTIFGNPGERDGVSGDGAFLTNPMDCGAGPVSAAAEVTGWEGGAAAAQAVAYPRVSGCGLLQGAAAFDPSLAVVPETSQADVPSGYEVDVRVPQAPSVFGALATPELRDASVTLPVGVSISPAAASGPGALGGCAPGQIDLQGTEVGEGHPGGNASPYDDGGLHASPGHCPDGSRIGTVEVKTPVLADPLEGHVYLEQPQCGGPGQVVCTEAMAEEGRVFGLYLEAAGSGVVVKLPGVVEVGGVGSYSERTGLAPGQIRTRFDEDPQFPAEDVKIVLAGGQRAALANPQGCGTATAGSDLRPWSAPESGPDATPSSSFAVTGCPAAQPFSPGFNAGTVSSSAGAFSPFTLTVSRQDGEQDLLGVTVNTPPGLLGMLSKVQLCGEPQAAQGACGAGSLIGHVQVAAGSGSEPLWQSGSVYLTGGYEGAPFGLSIVVPAVAGPFDLGNIVVRAAIHVDPHTAALTVTSDPLPQLVDGVPLRVKTVNVTIDKPGFTFNPTNCDQLRVAGSLGSAQGASVNVSSPFAAGGCANLPFKPSFKVSTQAKTSKKGGAGLDVKVGSGAGYPGGQSQANIGRVAVSLPRQLPSRLSTIQQACPQAVFDANPASCPAGSNIGVATAKTPVLTNPVTGPAYLVSHGGAAFPDLVVILQGEGITLDLVGSIDIKHGVTSSTFASVPDAPISSFELKLPEGPHSALAAVLPAKAKGSLCGTSLTMPTTLTGQNGAVVKQTTKIAVTGCPKAARRTHRKKKAKPSKHTQGAHRQPVGEKKGK